MKTLVIIITCILSVNIVTAKEIELKIIKKSSNGHGLLCKLQDKKTVLFVHGSPEEMGQAHGELLKDDITAMKNIINCVALGYYIKKKDNFYSRIIDVIKQSAPHTPKRFITECDSMAKTAGLSKEQGRQINFFPEMFHCSGVAVRGKATTRGQVIHARVLDYMFNMNLQKYAVLMVFMPEKYNNWISVSYPGIVGTVTAMNDKGLAMGEMGGKGGEGKWSGLPMTFLMRRIMEECSTVDEAVKLIKSVPLTCNYYYVLSDKDKNMCGIKAFWGTPVKVYLPGQQDKELPPVPQDCVYISGSKRKKYLSERLHANFGKIDAGKMIEIIKRPVAMKSNLHNAIFLPESLTMYFSDADSRTLACNMPYYKVNLKELIAFYKSTMHK